LFTEVHFSFPVGKAGQPVRLTSAHLHNFQRAFHHLYSIYTLFRGTIQGTHAPPAAAVRDLLVLIFAYLHPLQAW